MRFAVLVLFAVALPGCVEPATSHESWRFSGTFTQDYTPADRDAVCEAATEDGAQECVMMESFPEQYSFRFMTEDACRDARERVLAVPHTTGVTDCVQSP